MASPELMDFAESDASPAEAIAVEDVSVWIDDDPPPAGTACAVCKGLGHWCQARCYRGVDTPLCRACADGVDCSVVRARLRRVEADWMPSMEPETSAASAVRDVTPVDAAKRVAKPDPVQVRRNEVGRAIGMGSFSDEAGYRESEAAAAARRERYVLPAPVPLDVDEPEIEVAKEDAAMSKEWKPVITEEQKEAIRTANPGESAKQLAQRLGIEKHLVYYWRGQFKRQKGLPAPKVEAVAKRQTAALKKAEPTGVPIDMEDVGPRVVALGSPLPVTIEGGAIQVQAARIDAWFAKLPVERKAELFFRELGI